MKNISVVTVVYNEESRIDNLLKNFLWSNDVIVVDKSSTDRTREIVKKYSNNIITVPYSDTGDEGKLAVAQAKNEWVLGVTASDIIHPALVDKLLELINRENFDYDIIALPYAVKVFGLHNKRSPWYFPLKQKLFKKTVFVPKNEVHRETSFNSKKVYKMKKDETEAMFHLTHQSVDSFFERCIRYTRAETKKYQTKRQGLLQTSKEIILAFFWLILHKKIFLLGWDGIALALAFLSYFFMKFLYIWEKFSVTGEQHYFNFRKELLSEWEEHQKASNKP